MKPKKVILIALSLVLMLACREPVFASPKKVSRIKSHPGRYDGRRVSVSGYIAEVEYIPHENVAVLHLKLTDTKKGLEERSQLKRREYLLTQKVGDNIEAISKVYNESQTARDRQDKVIVKGVYDEESTSLELDTFVYFIGKKKHYIYVDKVNKHYSWDDKYYDRWHEYYHYPHFHFGYGYYPDYHSYYYPYHHGYYPGYYEYDHGYHGYHFGHYGY